MYSMTFSVEYCAQKAFASISGYLQSFMKGINDAKLGGAGTGDNYM